MSCPVGLLGLLGGPTWPQERLWLWRLLFPPLRAACAALYPMRVSGRAFRPHGGAYIVVANHTNWLDPPVIEFALGVAVRFMAKEEAFDTPVLGGLMRAKGCFPVRRGAADRRALQTCLRVLAAGRPLGFFPEGTRSRDGVMRRGHPGVGFLAVRSGAPILPVGVVGTHQRAILGPCRGRIEVRIGAPFLATELVPAGRHDEQALTDAIMERVAALLPPEMRGVHATRGPTEPTEPA
ncbi:MAG TPA: lysophospholipid acyltransferase family protein [Candidatus Limnocylindria bacterium]|jgi:1-acyl-sn-glycerol-3-phosphate acyltransferase